MALLALPSQGGKIIVLCTEFQLTTCRIEDGPACSRLAVAWLPDGTRINHKRSANLMAHRVVGMA